jgi:hypothetical protein
VGTAGFATSKFRTLYSSGAPQLYSSTARVVPPVEHYNFACLADTPAPVVPASAAALPARGPCVRHMSITNLPVGRSSRPWEWWDSSGHGRHTHSSEWSGRHISETPKV